MSDDKQVKKGWKVLSKGRYSVLMSGKNVRRRYLVGQTVKRDPKLGPLFVFDNKEAATLFAICNDKVVPCDYVPADDTPVVFTGPGCSRVEIIKRITSCRSVLLHAVDWPPSTAFAESVTCLE